jgi:hypothetical protein
MAPPNHSENARHEPLFDIHPLTGASIEIFYADRALETFGKGGAGWFWWPRRPGFAPHKPPTGPFATSYAAYRHAVTPRSPTYNVNADTVRTR